MKKELEQPQTYTDIYQLRVFGAYYFAYDLFIYAYGEKVEYIMVCKDYCNDAEPEIIAVTKKTN